MLLLQSHPLSLKVRRQIFESLVLSKLLYGAEVWFIFDKANMKYFRSAIMRLCRGLLKLPHDAHISDESILHDSNLPAPEVFLRRQRPRYVFTLIKCNAVAPCGLLMEDIDWLAQLKDDFQWMYSQLEHSSPFTDPTVDFDRWMNILSSRPGYWKNLVKGAV